MRLVKQSLLYFKEGNSDKVYEIDLCEVGGDKYVVNFRYGRRGAVLKEGSKTPVPVSHSEAEKIFNTVEEEKLNKGYTSSTDGVSSIPKKSSFTLKEEMTIDTEWMNMPAGRTKAILLRLAHAVQGNADPTKKTWKLSRVIWKAGQYKITEAAPYIVKLFNKGDTLHQYCCTWALVRCGNEGTAKALQEIWEHHHSPLIVKIAGVGLSSISAHPQTQQLEAGYRDSLPEGYKDSEYFQNLETNQPLEPEALLQQGIAHVEPPYNWLETTYLLSFERKGLRPYIKKQLQQIPFKPGYFKHIRGIFKLAEMLDDFELTGLLACRFEREEEFFAYNIPANDPEDETYVEAIEEYINPHKELRKKNSRLAWSQKTRWYLHRRVRRQLQLLGNANNTDYVKLATSLLIAYDRKLDFKEAFTTQQHKWNGRNYVKSETRYPQNARAVFLHQILSGDHPDLLLTAGSIWRIRSKGEASSSSASRSSAHGQPKNDSGLLKKIMGLFGKKKEPARSEHLSAEQAAVPIPNENGTPYLHLWNQLPQSWVQLLMEAQMEEVHEFAIGGLTAHPAFNDIKARLDKEAFKKLLLSPFTIPAEFGYTLALEKYAIQQPDADLAIAMLNSMLEKARHKGKELTATYQASYLQQSEFVKDLIFAVHPEIQSWAKELLKTGQLNSEVRNAAVGKSIAHLMSIQEILPGDESMLNRASDTLLELFAPELQEISLTITSDLLQHSAPAVLLFGLRLLKARKQQVKPEELNRSLLFGLLQHSHAPVREEGISFLSAVNETILLNYRQEMIACCTSPFQNVRQGLPAIIGRMAQTDNAFGVEAATALMPYLLRKENSDGLHNDVSRLLCNELSDYLKDANKETALRLLYGNYAAAQNVGVVILEKYTDPAQLTIPQVIALGNHENLHVRNWCWQFYTAQTPRIKYENEAAIKLLESKWTDTRQFAMQYFREQFGESDWSPEALITLADSVKPDVEAYGRELITRFFNSEQGVQYLIKLSQHPSSTMQLFATNYLERFAADDVEKIQSLEFYFRSVLTRVNKSRIAKNRIYHFLLTEGRKSEAAARTVSNILSEISAIAAIGDKAKCVEILLQLRSLYEVQTLLKVKEIETRS